MFLRKLTINGDRNISSIEVNFHVKDVEEEPQKYLIKETESHYLYPAIGMVGSDSDNILDLEYCLNFLCNIHTLKKTDNALKLLPDYSLTFIIEFNDGDDEYTYTITADNNAIHCEEFYLDGCCEFSDDNSKSLIDIDGKVLEFLKMFNYYDLSKEEFPKKLVDEISDSCKKNADHLDSLRDYLIQRGYVENMHIKEDYLAIQLHGGDLVSIEKCNATDIIRIIMATISLDALEEQRITIINGLNKICTIYDQVNFIENFCKDPNENSKSQLLFTSDQDCIEWRRAFLFDDQVLLVDFEKDTDFSFIRN